MHSTEALASGISVTTGDLHRTLEEIFRQPVVGLSRRLSVYSSSFAIEEIDVLFADAVRTRTIFKDLSPSAVLDDAAAVKPAFLYNPLREIEVYRRILSLLKVGAPRLYGSVADQKIKRYWLFLEKIPGIELYQIGDFEVWMAVARWLARFHSSKTCEPARARSLVPELLEYDAEFCRSWLDRALDLVGTRLERLASRYERVLEVLLGLPRSLIHGEFYASNILIQTEPNLRVSPVDWEMSGIGPGLLDLAALASGKWTRAQQLRLAGAYFSNLPISLCPKDFATAFDCCQLQVALQWLGWSRNWVAHPAHAHDWLTDALSLIGGESLSRLLS